MSFGLRLDIDPVITCPYDENHKIAKSRIQRHLVKCEKNFPPDYKQQCPYDATHRVFQHELVDHVENCPMKISYTAIDNNARRLPEIEPELDISNMDDGEVWDEGREAATASNPFNEPTFGDINMKQYTTVASIRGNMLRLKTCNSKLRRPFGYSESLMLDVSSQENDDDDDAKSVTSDICIGRGQSLSRSYVRGQPSRGAGMYRRGVRGRFIR